MGLVNDTDKATDILLDALELNDIPMPIATKLSMRVLVSLCILQKMNSKDFCKIIDNMKIDYKAVCDALKIR